MDTGAAKSCIAESVRRSLRKVLTPAHGRLLRMGNGELVRPLGYSTVFMLLGGSRYVVLFTVLQNCVADVILGCDFLTSNEAFIDCSSGELHLNICDTEDALPDSPPVVLRTADDIHVPAFSAVSVQLVPESRFNSACGLVEPIVTTFAKKGVLVPHSIARVKTRRVHLYITNPSAEPLMLPRGSRIATIQTCDEHAIASLSPAPTTTKLQAASADTLSERTAQMIDSSLTNAERESLQRLLSTYSDLFDFSRHALTQTTTVTHQIDTGAATPLKSRPYRISPAERKTIKENVADMLDKKIIEPSSSPWSSPVILVKKDDGSWRFCVDYRRLNKVTKKDVYPLPRIDDTLDALQGSSFFSSLDLRSGYWQIPVSEEDKPKTAFVTPDGLYQFNVMPFGLCNAPATFERMMDTLLRGLTWNICLCYLDDVVVFSTTFDDHLYRLRQVLDCFRNANLQLNSKKCKFGAREIKVLGHLVSIDGIRPDPSKIQAVSEFPVPRNLKDVRAFLGLCTYFRKFIPAFSNIAEPLNKLLRLGQLFHWDQDQMDAFTSLKAALISVPILGHFLPGADTEIRTDASGHGLGALLAQNIRNTQRVIAYASRTLTKSERNYTITERECLAVIWAISKFRPYLYGIHFRIVTDHHALCWLTGLKDPSGRLARWSLKIQQYDFTIVYKSGKRHLDADALSRCPLSADSSPHEPHAEIELSAVLDTIDVADAQLSDQELQPIVRHLLGPTTPSSWRIQRRARLFTLHDGVLYRKNYEPHGRPWLLVVPRLLRKDIIRAHHDDPTAGHLGFSKTYFRIRDRYFWNGMSRTINKYIRSCRLCQTQKSRTTKTPGPLQSITPPESPFQQMGIDFLGPFPISNNNNRWVIVAVDYLTRYAETTCVRTATAQDAADFFLHSILLRHGAPQNIISDRGTPFIAKLIEEVLRLTNTIHKVTSAYHPQSNGLTERLNRTLSQMISMYVDDHHTNWDAIIPYITYAYNTAHQATTGFSPYYLLYAREPLTPLDTILPSLNDQPLSPYATDIVGRAEDARRLARLHTLRSQQDQQLRHSETHGLASYEVGDRVLLATPRRQPGKSEKLLQKYVGPYVVLRRLSPTNYQVSPLSPPRDHRSKSTDIVHVARMKPFHSPDDATSN